MMPPSQIADQPVVSINQLARELGVSATSVSRRMRRGQSQDEIRRIIMIKREAGLLNQSAPVNTLTGQMRAMVEAAVRKVAGVGKGRVNGSPGGPASAPSSSSQSTLRDGASASSLSSSVSDYLFRNVPRGPRESVKIASIPDIPSGNGQTGTPENGVLPPGFQRLVEESFSQEGIDAARLRRARALADAQELANRAKRGELVPLDLANAHFTKVFSTLIERAGRIGGEIADALAAETDPVRCRQLVEREISGVLRELKSLVLRVG